MSIDPLISVILPVYNVEKYLEKSIRSVINQTYKNMEIILIDDGSTDRSGEMCDELAGSDTRIHVIHQKNRGLSAARNRGIEESHGDYLTFIDSDDYVADDMVEYLYLLIKKFDCKMSLCSHTIVFTETGKKHPLGDGSECKMSALAALESMLYHGLVDTSAWAKLYSRDLWKDVRYPEGKLFEDIGTTYKLFIESEWIACGFKPKYFYFVRKGSIVTSNFSSRNFDLLEMTDQMGEGVLSVFPTLNKAVLRRQMYARFSVLNKMIGVQGFSNYRKQISQFISNNWKEVFLDNKTPCRDKFAILAFNIAPWFYNLAWKLYKH